MRSRRFLRRQTAGSRGFDILPALKREAFFDWYEDAAVQAVASVLSPVGWEEGEIKQYVAETNDETLAGFIDG